MTDENATPGGYSGASVLADVSAVMRGLVGLLLSNEVAEIWATSRHKRSLWFSASR
jgi:hypothetical protein